MIGLLTSLVMPFWAASASPWEPQQLHKPTYNATHNRPVHNRVIKDGRPRKWCGWHMRKLKGVADLRYNKAISWAKYGSPVSGPAPNVIVVWRNHVGIIIGKDSKGRWLVHSGNDSNKVKTRARSLKGVIAYRV